MKPVFEHDCRGCRFLDHRHGADLYFCPGAIPRSTLIARTSDEPSQYESMPLSMVIDLEDTHPDHLSKRLSAALELLRGSPWAQDYLNEV